MALALASYFFSSKKEKEARERVPAQPKRPNTKGLPKAVIIGGGHSGAKLASRLDSIFDVVLVDKKNFLNNYGPATVGDILTSDYVANSISNEAESAEEVKRIYLSCFPLHRFYLKRANVVLGNVEEVHANEIIVRKPLALASEPSMLGKLREIIDCAKSKSSNVFSIPYDLLFFAVGEELPFPFQSSACTRNERMTELQQLISHLQSRNVRKIAILGGGPCGVSLTKMLSKHAFSDNQLKELHLFYSSDSLLPAMPKKIQKEAFEELRCENNVHLHSRRKVVDVEGISVNNHQWYQWIQSIGQSLLQRGVTVKEIQGYSVSHTHAPPNTSYWHQHRNRSLLHHLFFGKEGNPCNVREALSEDVSINNTTPITEKFDYVFDCTGGTPRVNTPLLSGKIKNEFFDITQHLNEDGYFRVNRFFQLYSHPNIFAIGRCVATSPSYLTGEKWMYSPYDFGQQLSKTHSLSSSTCQVDYVFNHLLAIVSSPKNAESGFAAQKIRGFPNHNNFFHYWPPQVLIPFGKGSSIGVFSNYPQLHFATPFSASFEIVGKNANRRYLEKEREQHCKSFVKPSFYQDKDPLKTRTNFNLWLNNVEMNPEDFFT
ncbi:Pyridine nucleotide-disulfide oxidoreductase [Perkinsela sp. CCAP 1560/4]|nr:Pyridine nucleotide-disulfide oxidoreductase NAD-binding domain [Perkinsela sp. CCAP 1560/4]KNH08867.1 Pyridine nucleotide-disulfide oxidoreductase [Perkinsela sp. CCAP 1560/4]|eukprot:KNH06748.1 Pyridine nucleotide-disulfide oxidoreductase NAD-binding domain [Perkinsela sp. CCAP 1560/4]